MNDDLEDRVKKMLAAEDHPGDIAMIDLIEDLWKEIEQLRHSQRPIRWGHANPHRTAG